MSSLADRLSKAFDPAIHSKADLARSAGVKAPSVSDWFTGDTKSLKAAPLVKAAMYLGVSPLWLATGEGPMKPHIAAPAPMAAEPPPTYNVSPLPGVTLEELATLDARALENLAHIARGMLMMSQTANSGNAAAR